MPDPHPLTKISSEQLSAEIDRQGAQLFTLRDATGRDLLWNGDPAVWSGRSPLLFPIVGSLIGNTYNYAGQSYHLPRHGFARNRLFQLQESTAASATFRLGWDAVTLQTYPFAFQLDVTYSLVGPSLQILAEIRNLGGDDMPASFGFHPALRWPLVPGNPRNACFISFDTDEPAPIRRLNHDGLIAPTAEPSPVKGRVLPLRDDLFSTDVLIFDQIRSRRLWYGGEAGPKIQFDFPGMPHLGIWTKPGAGFICIEPWHGFSDPAGFTGDFRTKPGVFTVGPGEAQTCAMTMTLCA